MGEKILRKYLGFCSFVGLKYRGYQEQKYMEATHKTIQQTIELALSQITKSQTKISSCSRTDAGVNAYCLPFHFIISTEAEKLPHTKEILKTSLNYHLRYEDIKINDIKEVPLDFDVRKQCLEKEYIYRIEAGLGDSIYHPIQQHKLVYSVSSSLNVIDMKMALNSFLGVHNFYNFTVRNNKLKSEKFRYIRKINEVYLEENNEERNLQKIIIGFKGHGFLTYQIRYMVSALKDVGEGNYPIQNIAKALDCNENDNPDIGRKAAPAKGLFLKNVIFKP